MTAARARVFVIDAALDLAHDAQHELALFLHLLRLCRRGGQLGCCCVQIVQLLLDACQQIHLFALQGIQLLEGGRIAGCVLRALFGRAIVIGLAGAGAQLGAKRIVGGWQQGRCGANAFFIQIAAAHQIVLGDGLRIGRGFFIRAGVDQNHIQRCVFKNAVVDAGRQFVELAENHRHSHQMKCQRNTHCNAHGRTGRAQRSERKFRRGGCACHDNVQRQNNPAL